MIVDKNDLYLPDDNLTLNAETSTVPSNQSGQAMEDGRKTTIIQRSRRKQKHSRSELVSSRQFSAALRNLQYGNYTCTFDLVSCIILYQSV